MKKIIMFLLVAFIGVSSVACSVKEDPQESEAATLKGDAQQNEEENSNPTTSSEKVFDEKMALFYADDVDGHSVQEYEGSLYCIDSKGNITYKLPDGEINVTQIYNDIFLTYDGKKGRIRKYDGTEITVQGEIQDFDLLFLAGKQYYENPFEINADKAARCNYMANELLKDGYILVLRTTDTYAGSTFELGFLNLDGSWRVPLSSKNPLLLPSYFNIDTFLENILYCQEGVIRFYFNDDIAFYYDIEDNKIYRLDEVNLYLGEDSFLSFYDGVAFCEKLEWHQNVQTWGEYAIFPDGTSKLLGRDWSWLCFYNRSSNSGIAIDSTNGTNYLIDTNGKTIKKFEGSIWYMEPIEGTDTIQLLFGTENNKQFYTKIDAQGNFLFEPIALDNIPVDIYGENSCRVFDSKGNSIGNSIGYGSTCIFVVDDNGEILYREDNSYQFELRNGIIKNNGVYVKLEK